ncbi:hypothetical protein T492DRAFT_247631 [Pavlovales sp. CCMP2436]|nr:hypothetical protein T492DRAFT_247631 [Pavlovales sp. CCMP2436]
MCSPSTRTVHRGGVTTSQNLNVINSTKNTHTHTSSTPLAPPRGNTDDNRDGKPILGGVSTEFVVGEFNCSCVGISKLQVFFFFFSSFNVPRLATRRRTDLPSEGQRTDHLMRCLTLRFVSLSRPFLVVASHRRVPAHNYSKS